MASNKKIKLIINAVFDDIPKAENAIQKLQRTVTGAASNIRTRIQQAFNAAGGDLATFGGVTKRAGADTEQAFKNTGAAADKLKTKVGDLPAASEKVTKSFEQLIKKQKEADLAWIQYSRSAAKAFSAQKALEAASDATGQELEDLTEEALKTSIASDKLYEKWDDLRRQAEGVSDATETVTQTTGKASKAFSALQGVVGTLSIAAVIAKITQEVVKFGKASLEAKSAFETGFAEVSTLLGDIDAAGLEKLEEQTRAFSLEIGKATDEVLPALYQALSAGVPQDNVFEFLRVASQAARGGVTDLETAVDGISSVVNAYGSDVLSATEASDLLFGAVVGGKTTFEELSSEIANVTPLAAANGIAFQDVSTALAELTAKGTSTATATTQLRAAIAELTKEGSEVNKTFQEAAGVGFRDFIAEGGNLADALKLLQAEAERQGVVIGDLFSSIEAGSAVLALGSDGFVGYSKAIDDASESIGATAEAAAEFAETTATQEERIAALTNEYKILTGEGLNPLKNAFLGAKEAFLEYELGIKRAGSAGAELESGFAKIAEASGGIRFEAVSASNAFSTLSSKFDLADGSLEGIERTSQLVSLTLRALENDTTLLGSEAANAAIRMYEFTNSALAAADAVAAYLPNGQLIADVQTEAAAAADVHTEALGVLTEAELTNVESTLAVTLATQELTAAQIEAITEALALAAADGELTQAEIDLAIANATTEQSLLQKQVALLETASATLSAEAADLNLATAEGIARIAVIEKTIALNNATVAALEYANAIREAAGADATLVQNYGSGLTAETAAQIDLNTAAFERQFSTVRGGASGAGSAVSSADKQAEDFAKTLRDDVVGALDAERTTLEAAQKEYQKYASTLAGIVTKGFDAARSAGESFFKILADPEADPEALAEATQEILDNQYETVVSLIEARRGDSVEDLTQNLDLRVALGITSPDQAEFEIKQKEYFEAVDKLFGADSVFLDAGGATVDIGELFLNQDGANQTIAELAQEIQQTVDAGFGSEVIQVNDLATKLVLNGTIEDDQIDETIDSALDSIRGGLSAEQALALELGGGEELTAQLEALAEQELVQDGAEERIEFLTNASEILGEVEGLAQTVATIDALAPYITIGTNSSDTTASLAAIADQASANEIPIPTGFSIADGAIEQLSLDVVDATTGIDDAVLVPVELSLTEEGSSFDAVSNAIAMLQEPIDLLTSQLAGQIFDITFATNAAEITLLIDSLKLAIEAVPQEWMIAFESNAAEIMADIDALTEAIEAVPEDWETTFDTNAATEKRDVDALTDAIDAVPERKRIVFDADTSAAQVAIDDLIETYESFTIIDIPVDVELAPALRNIENFRTQQESTPITIPVQTSGSGGTGGTPPPGGTPNAFGGIYRGAQSHLYEAHEDGDEIAAFIPLTKGNRGRELSLQLMTNLMEAGLIAQDDFSAPLPNLPPVPQFSAPSITASAFELPTVQAPSFVQRPSNVSNTTTTSSVTGDTITENTTLNVYANDANAGSAAARQFNRRRVRRQ